ncbi:hypothetical protein OW763_14530 [Clostridium aestuarii]|uniref:Uncharacterized protein n=1 Tax=Clostridium aestuarii TaxID=338193 RepID=A0ABT4D2T3_9CLOT|nr:hypothetical protein [Clostridium aestuarii]MCY6485548.1 hypothetical protein [Clostridium aestuarii]
MVGNLLIYGIDKIGVLNGQNSMSINDFIVLNVIVVGLGILIPFLMDNKRFNKFINKIL